MNAVIDLPFALPTIVAGLTLLALYGPRGWSGIDLAYTAAGIFDGFFELHLSRWDVAAGSLMITEAGGVVSDFSGGDLWFERGNIIGAPPGMHRELVALIARYTREEQLDR